MQTLPTVKVDDGKGGFYIINESDYDPKKHTKHGDNKAESKPIARRRKANYSE